MSQHTHSAVIQSNCLATESNGHFKIGLFLPCLSHCYSSSCLQQQDSPGCSSRSSQEHVCREHACDMVQEGPVHSFPPGHCCKWELEGENRSLVLSQILSSFQETQQQPRFCSVWVRSSSMWHKWNTLSILRLYGNSDKACVSWRMQGHWRHVQLSRDFRMNISLKAICESASVSFNVCLKKLVWSIIYTKDLRYNDISLLLFHFLVWWQRKATLNHWQSWQ